MEALTANGVVIQLEPARFEVNEALVWATASAGVQVSDLWDGTSFSRPIAPPAPPPAPVYVPLALIRERVTAAGHWDAFAGAVDGLPAAQRWHLLTLTEGVAPDDADAVALLTAIGCDPSVILAPPGT